MKTVHCYARVKPRISFGEFAGLSAVPDGLRGLGLRAVCRSIDLFDGVQLGFTDREKTCEAREIEDFPHGPGQVHEAQLPPVQKRVDGEEGTDDWLKADLAATNLPTVLLTHQLLNPQEQIDPNFDVQHCVRNAAAVRSALEASGKVVAVFSGHYHDRGFQIVSGISYVVLQANTAYGNDVSYHNQYATVDVYTDGKNVKLAVAGNGMQGSYVIRAVIKWGRSGAALANPDGAVP